MHKIVGIVVKGKQKGVKLGFPTANVEVENKPNSGIYAGEVILGSRNYKAAIFIPMEGNSIEAHILNFSEDIYGIKIEILVGKKIREIKNFQDDNELTKQIKKDLEIIEFND